MVVLNRTLLRTIETLARSKEEVNSYVFMVLAHEYIHSLATLMKLK